MTAEVGDAVRRDPRLRADKAKLFLVGQQNAHGVLGAAGNAPGRLDHADNGGGVIDQPVNQLAARQHDSVVMCDQQDFATGFRPDARRHVIAKLWRGAFARERLDRVGEPCGVHLRFQRGKAAILSRLSESGDAIQQLLRRGGGRRWLSRRCARGKRKQECSRQRTHQNRHEASCSLSQR